MPSPSRSVIVLTGGPGGGKTTLIEELVRDPAWGRRFVALPEAIYAMRYLNISPREKLFQRVMVHLQMALEDGLNRALDSDDPRAILYHRGSLDPLAYWLDRGWPEEEFFAFTGTKREEHYRRYTAIIHLVTAADGAAAHYTRWPDAHRPEQIEDAIRLGNEGRDWAAKAKEARDILSDLFPSMV